MLGDSSISQTSCDAGNVIGSIVWRPIIKYIVTAAALLQCTPGIQAADAPVPIEAFAQLPKMSGAELSPDGRFLAYFRPIEGRRHLVVQPIHSTDRPLVIPRRESRNFHG